MRTASAVRAFQTIIPSRDAQASPEKKQRSIFFAACVRPYAMSRAEARWRLFLLSPARLYQLLVAPQALLERSDHLDAGDVRVDIE